MKAGPKSDWSEAGVMLMAKDITVGILILYGVYVYRVLRHAEYHDLYGFFRRRRSRHADESVHPANFPDGRQTNHEPDGLADYCIDRGVLRPVRVVDSRLSPAEEVKIHD